VLTTVTGSVRFNVTQRDSIALRRCAPGVSSERHRPRRAQRQRLSLSHSYHPSTSDHRPDPTLLTYQFSDTATWEWWTKPFIYKDFSPYVRRSGFPQVLDEAQAARVAPAQLGKFCRVSDDLPRRGVAYRRRPEASLGQALGRKKPSPDARHPDTVGVRLGGHFGALGTGLGDHVQDAVCVFHMAGRRRVDVAVVHMRPGLSGGADDLDRSVYRRCRVNLDEVPRVRVGGCPCLRCGLRRLTPSINKGLWV
jgi:hypothetical protein